ncbi:MAG: hypothetical protein R3F61_07085 [Myxococcota bacterium]
MIGRQHELHRIREFLADAGTPRLVHLEGVPGVGKSTLLRELVRAGSEPYRVEVVPGATRADERTGRLKQALRPVERPTMVVVDDWDDLAPDQPAHVRRLEACEGPLALVVASCQRPGPQILQGALFPDRLLSVELQGLAPDVLDRLLAPYGVDGAESSAIHRVTAGHPFAAILLAWESAEARSLAASGELAALPAQRVVERIADRITDPRLRDLLALIALAGSVNVHEIARSFRIDAADASVLYERAVALTLTHVSPEGLTVAPMVRTALLSELLARDPEHARRLVGSLVATLRPALAWTGRPRHRALDQLASLVASSPQDVALSGFFASDTVEIFAGYEGDVDAALEVLAAHVPEAQVSVARRWIGHDPGTLTVLRRSGRVEAVMVRAEWRGCEVPDALRDPVVDGMVGRLGDRLEGDRPVRVTRFFVSRRHGQLPSPELATLGTAMTRHTLQQSEPFVNVLLFTQPAFDAWREVAQQMQYEALDDGGIAVEGAVWTPFVREFHELGEAFVELVHEVWGLEAVPEAPVAAPRVGERDVVAALRHRHDRVWLQDCELGRCLFAETSRSERAGRLEQWLDAAIASTASMYRGQLVESALRAAFDGNHSLVEAAAAAGMGLSTLKRYRKEGVAHITRLAGDGWGVR